MAASPFPVSLAPRRLARFLREAASAHVRREFGRAEGALGRASALLAVGPRLAPGEDEEEGLRAFLAAWGMAIEEERAGQELSVAPAAWMHLGQELAARLEQAEPIGAFLRARWRLEARTLGGARRLALSLGAVGLAVLGLFFCWLVGSVLLGTPWLPLLPPTIRSWGEGLLSFLRLVGWLGIAYGCLRTAFRWACRAWRGEEAPPRPRFLPPGKGLDVVH